jgi:hypothetical protein
MATKESIVLKLRNLIDVGNATTGKEDTNLNQVVDSLVEGYGQGGVDTTDATAQEGDLLLGQTAYVNEVKVTGTIPTYSGETTGGVEIINQ